MEPGLPHTALGSWAMTLGRDTVKIHGVSDKDLASSGARRAVPGKCQEVLLCSQEGVPCPRPCWYLSP